MTIVIRARTLVVARVALLLLAGLSTLAMFVLVGRAKSPATPTATPHVRPQDKQILADGPGGPGAPEPSPQPTPSAEEPAAHPTAPGDPSPTHGDDQHPPAGHEAPTHGDDKPPSAADTHPTPVATSPVDVDGAADYVRSFYADLSERRFSAAWPRLAEDLRKRHGSFEAWQRGFATTVRQSASEISAAAAGPSTASVSLTLTAVDRDECEREVTRRFAVLWRLDHQGDEWHAVHAEAKVIEPSPTAVAATCRSASATASRR